MPRVTVTISDEIHDKLMKYAEDNKRSLSFAVTKMAELGLLVTERKGQKINPEDKFSEIEKHCFKAIIQMNALLKNIAGSQLNYGKEEFDKLSKLSIDKYQELMGLFPEEI